MNTYYVYIMTNHSRTLYTGVTNDMKRRVREHKLGRITGFASKYKINQLVFVERFSEVDQAIAWEKKLKGWVRAKKVELIESRNPHWEDLAADWKVSSTAVEQPASRARSFGADASPDDTLRSTASHGQRNIS